MKAKFTINGNIVEIDGTPSELAEILFGIRAVEDQPTAPAPEEPPKSSMTSFAKTYHQVLGMTIREYIAKDPSLSTDTYVIDIMNKITEANLPTPPEARLRKTIEASKQPPADQPPQGNSQ